MPGNHATMKTANIVAIRAIVAEKGIWIGRGLFNGAA
jgi:hypothetical protein